MLVFRGVVVYMKKMIGIMFGVRVKENWIFGISYVGKWNLYYLCYVL